MAINSWEFMIFFAAAFIICWAVPHKFRYLSLTILSGIYCAVYSVTYLLTMGTMAVASYVAVRVMYKVADRYRKYILTICLILCTSPLILLKYAERQVSSDADFFMPLGISYYTFSMISYMVDAYRGHVRQMNILEVFLYLAYFPKIISGPIEKSKEFLDKIQKLKEADLSFHRIEKGMQRILYGLFLKMVIADRAALLTTYVYDNYQYLGTVELVLGSILYSIQIYMDFAGYTHLAVGVSYLLGIQLKENFRLPYLSGSIYDFWKRWHISLTDWLRDYIYVPLGGNRKGKFCTDMNILVVFLVSGFWHGAGAGFLAWGGIHGLCQIIGKHTRRQRDQIYTVLGFRPDSVGYRISQRIMTFSLVNFAWIFFRAESLSAAFKYIKRMITIWDPWNLFNGQIYELGLSMQEWHIFWCAAGVALMAEIYEYLSGESIGRLLRRQSLYVRSAVYILSVSVLFVYALYGTATKSTFIYFHF